MIEPGSTHTPPGEFTMLWDFPAATDYEDVRSWIRQRQLVWGAAWFAVVVAPGGLLLSLTPDLIPSLGFVVVAVVVTGTARVTTQARRAVLAGSLLDLQLSIRLRHLHRRYVADDGRSTSAFVTSFDLQGGTARVLQPSWLRGRAWVLANATVHTRTPLSVALLSDPRTGRTRLRSDLVALASALSASPHETDRVAGRQVATLAERADVADRGNRTAHPSSIGGHPPTMRRLLLELAAHLTTLPVGLFLVGCLRWTMNRTAGDFSLGRPDGWAVLALTSASVIFGVRWVFRFVARSIQVARYPWDRAMGRLLARTQPSIGPSGLSDAPLDGYGPYTFRPPDEPPRPGLWQILAAQRRNRHQVGHRPSRRRELTRAVAVLLLGTGVTIALLTVSGHSSAGAGQDLGAAARAGALLVAAWTISVVVRIVHVGVLRADRLGRRQQRWGVTRRVPRR